ncbi:MAG TPA: efflux RND transporter periplasmic adaptor subunit [Bryobacteraceae bacterium]|nr:efflux RND transporter periplasmic adaptor subunit [Bryobacteraceae bacterium]
MHKVFVLSLLAATLGAQQAVEVVSVVARPVERTVELPGEFLPYLSVAVHAKVTGFVERVEVDRGSVVRKDQLLATLEAPELRAQVLEAESQVRAAEARRAEVQAKLVAAQSTYERLKAASSTPGAVAANELIVAGKAVDAAQAQVRAEEASARASASAVQSLREMENYLRVTAPFAGVITERDVHPGALVGPAGQHSGALFQLEQNTRLRLVVAVPEVEVSGIVAGARVPFLVPAWPGETFQGVIARAAHSLDPKTRSMAVELDVTNPQGRLAPGMYPTVKWPVRELRAALLVPPSSVVTTTERTFVIRVKDGRIEWVDVAKGPPAGDLLEVFGPLRAGDAIVRRASDELRQGSRVTVRQAAPPKAS